MSPKQIAALYILILSMICTSLPIFGQNREIKGRVVDENDNGLQYASIKMEDIGVQLFSDEKGNFTISLKGKVSDRSTIRFSYLGKDPVTETYNLNLLDEIPKITLRASTFSLSEVTVQAKQGLQSNSSLVIDRDMIERYPSLSLNDLLNFLPNRKVTAPSVQEMQNVTMRGAFNEATGAMRNVDMMNNSFGTAIILDDIAISNNSNMQSRNPNITGLSNARLSITSSNYGVGGDNIASSYSGESSFGGVDIRQIPTESIERIEYITGVAPVRYGDITDGAVIVERQAGKTPAFFRLQTRNNATSYGLSKGFRLSPALGDLNLDLSFVNSYADNRDKLKQYQRVNGSAIWTLRYGKSNKWKQTFSGTYNKIVDGVNKDPDDPQSTSVSYGSWNYNVSTRLSYQPNQKFLKRVGLNFGLQNAHQVSYREYDHNDAYVLYTDTLGTGIVEGIYETGQYTSVNHIDGRPISINGRIEANAVANFAGISHYLNFGANGEYSRNNGRGRVSDPSRPNADIGRYSERYYDFSLIHPTWNVGFYLEDRMNTQLAGKPLNITAGVRADLQNGHASLSPRTNINYRLDDNIQIGLAYGLAFKAPSLAHLYPGPTFSETILLNSYNGKVNESTSRIFVYRHDPDPNNLQSQFSQTIEGSFRYQKNGHNLSINAYFKENKRGFNSTTSYGVLSLPQYSATARPGEKPTVEIIGYESVFNRTSQIANSNDRNNYGLELMYSTPKIQEILTSFNLATGITRSKSKDYFNSYKQYNEDGSAVDDVILGIFSPLRDVNYFSQGRIGSSTHIPKLRLIVEITADFQLMNFTKQAETDFSPLAYYTRDMVYHEIDKFDLNNPQHAFLYNQRKLEYEELNDKGNLIYGNFHLNVAKEINKNLRLSFNVYNFLDYQPRIRRSGGSSTTVNTPNTSPNYGAQITYKF